MAVHNAGAQLMSRAVHAACALLALMMLAAGCGGGVQRPPTGTPEPDRFLFERGTEQLNAKHWLVAREYFRQLVDSYPQSPFRADAKLGVGDTFLGERTPESYVLAANEFREFLTYYPTHQRAGYAQYKLGMTSFYQMHDAQRDQSETRDAIRELTQFVERYPRDPLIDEGKTHLREARDRLGMADYRVGYYYWRVKWYPAAIDRFKALLEADPQYSARDSVYFYLGDSLQKTQRPAEALPYFDKLVAEFESSEFLEEAKRRVEALKAEIEKKKG